MNLPSSFLPTVLSMNIDFFLKIGRFKEALTANEVLYQFNNSIYLKKNLSCINSKRAIGVWLSLLCWQYCLS